MLFSLTSAPDFSVTTFAEMGAAFAQDDDDDGDDDGGDDGGDDDGGDDDGADDGDDDGTDDDGVGVADDDDGGVDGTPGRQQTDRARGTGQSPTGGTSRRAPAPETPPAPLFAVGEIVVTDLSSADLAALQSEGFTLIERIALVEVAVVLYRLRPPEGLSLDQARDRVRARPTGSTGDFNHYYRYEEDASASPASMSPFQGCTHLNCSALSLIGWPALRNITPQCRVTVPVGVIDTGVNAAHENLVGADIEVLQLVAEEVDPSAAVHGTAVAALLVGQNPDRAPGLIPEAKLIAVDIFGRAGGDERASVASLVKALDLLSTRDVKVINLSLAGPPNTALEATLARIAEPGGAVVLAAAGNGGPTADVAYPAGYPSVIAVTAVDQRGQVYRRAQRGAHVDLAAPGVEVWSATSISGVRPKTGTSFAVPFATAVAAVLASRNPEASPAALAEEMRSHLRDLGPSGPDEVFGEGLLSLDALCAPKIMAGPVE